MIQDTVTAAPKGTAPRDGKVLLTVEEPAHRLGLDRTVMYRLVTSAPSSVTLRRLHRVPSECLNEFVTTLHDSQARKRHAATSAACARWTALSRRRSPTLHSSIYSGGDGYRHGREE